MLFNMLIIYDQSTFKIVLYIMYKGRHVLRSKVIDFFNAEFVWCM